MSPSSRKASWVKHADFIAIDLVCMQVCFALAFWATRGFGNPWGQDSYVYQAEVLLVAQLLVVPFADPYHGILRRGYLYELASSAVTAMWVLVLSLVWLFAVHDTQMASRLQLGLTLSFFAIMSWALRCARKAILSRSGKQRSKSLVLATSPLLAADAVNRLIGEGIPRDYELRGVIVFGDGDEPSLPGVDVLRYGKETLERVSRGWVDEVLVLQPVEEQLPEGLLPALLEMGVPVSYTNAALDGGGWSFTSAGSVGSYRVITAGISYRSPGQLVAKRLLDIAGGIVGCLVTLVMFPFVAIAIKTADPGPVFFGQERVGRNGRTFRMWKFRSMYTDAEERKAALASENKIEGPMFKIDSDPRILPGVGGFIRRTSIDEFPQFFNVLKGEMSLVGTRPPTLDEWGRYELSHRARMAEKPGITGLWQVSGRSEVTDFEEVVRLDREYISRWSLLLDLKILAKTVAVVIRGRGAE